MVTALLTQHYKKATLSEIQHEEAALLLLNS